MVGSLGEGQWQGTLTQGTWSALSVKTNYSIVSPGN